MSGIIRSLFNSTSTLVGKAIQAYVPSISMPLLYKPISGLTEIQRMGSSLSRLHRLGPYKKKHPKKNPLNGNPFLKAVVLKCVIKKPKKPNSANRKCVLIRLSNGRETIAYVPGIGHNLQEHNIVLVKVAKLQDTPGVKLCCVRGAYDLAHVIKPDTK